MAQDVKYECVTLWRCCYESVAADCEATLQRICLMAVVESQLWRTHTRFDCLEQYHLFCFALMKHFGEI